MILTCQNIGSDSDPSSVTLLNGCLNYSLSAIIIIEQEIQSLVEQAEQLVEVEPEAGDEGGEPAAASTSGSASADEAGT